MSNLLVLFLSFAGVFTLGPVLVLWGISRDWKQRSRKGRHRV